MSRILRGTGVLFAIACLAIATPAAATSQFESTLLKLADRALEEGDLENAEERYQRVLSTHPASARANAGMGRVHLTRGDLAAAKARFEQALAADADLIAAKRGLAEVAIDQGDKVLARGYVDAVLEAEPLDPELHQLRFELTGMAPTTDLELINAGRVTPAQVRALGQAYPYDPRIQLALAVVADYQGDAVTARGAARAALLTADLAPGAAGPATRLLRKLEGGRRRVVPVHLYADQTVRKKPYWAFELRLAWARVGAILDPLLHTVFAPISVHAFESGSVPDDLDAIEGTMVSSAAPLPPGGIIAGFTRRQSPRTESASRNGQAQYLGRVMFVRLDTGESDLRILVHEVLHIYGGIHLSGDIETVMNPTGGGLRLDQYNAEIVRLTAKRRFTSAPVAETVLAHLDENALADALIKALAVNIHFRAIGIEDILEKARGSRVAAAPIADEVIGQDQHLAQVAAMTAELLIRADRAAEAVLMMTQASQLYGPRTKDGKAAARTANQWRKYYKSFLAD